MLKILPVHCTISIRGVLHAYTYIVYILYLQIYIMYVYIRRLAANPTQTERQRERERLCRSDRHHCTGSLAGPRNKDLCVPAHVKVGLCVRTMCLVRGFCTLSGLCTPPHTQYGGKEVSDPGAANSAISSQSVRGAGEFACLAEEEQEKTQCACVGVPPLEKIQVLFLTFSRIFLLDFSTTAMLT